MLSTLTTTIALLVIGAQSLPITTSESSGPDTSHCIATTTNGIFCHYPISDLAKLSQDGTLHPQCAFIGSGIVCNYAHVVVTSKRDVETAEKQGEYWKQTAPPRKSVVKREAKVAKVKGEYWKSQQEEENIVVKRELVEYEQPEKEGEYWLKTDSPPRKTTVVESGGMVLDSKHCVQALGGIFCLYSESAVLQEQGKLQGQCGRIVGAVVCFYQ